ncbi:MAG: TetR/AcrR family transcriptional regulator, tetracycline repressor protein [Frankiales bacterium]|nr:TetR/AcrR family transcriptional regulator, tetracycline repressor protein [Frankiales bacterium]
MTIAKPRMGRPRHLSEAQVLDAALTLIDEVGVDGLTMEQLAASLGVGTSTVYGYVSSKQELLDAVVDHVVISAEVVALIDRSDWRIAAEAFTHGFRAVLIAHPNLAVRWTTREVLSPRAVESGRRLLEVMVEAGLPVESAAAAYFALESFTIGHVLWELPRLHAQPPQEYSRRLRAAASLAGWRTDLLVGVPDYIESATPDELFGRGIRLVLDGVEAQLSQRRRPRR